jgi:hypothetical protein
MQGTVRVLTLTLIALLGGAVRAPAAGKKSKAPETSGTPVLWRDPADWATRDLFYGPGGKAHEPHGPFTFVKEDLDGTNPKFVVRDPDGVKWKVKMGLEARPETVASRLVWAAGYYADEDYFVQDLRVEGLPPHLRRGQKLVAADGSLHSVRLKREREDKKNGDWQWTHDPFNNTREWNGLRTLMALINNWDLKDENNTVLRNGAEGIYEVSDLGASFGSAGRSWPRSRAKDNLDSYRRSRFIRHLTPGTVSFQVPARPMWVYLVNPKEYFSRLHLEPIGRNVPRADAKWLGQLLARLSPAQIRDAFRAAGYSREETESFARILEDRLTVLSDL